MTVPSKHSHHVSQSHSWQSSWTHVGDAVSASVGDAVGCSVGDAVGESVMGAGTTGATQTVCLQYRCVPPLATPTPFGARLRWYLPENW